jgi:hypothetical protein
MRITFSKVARGHSIHRCIMCLDDITDWRYILVSVYNSETHTTRQRVIHQSCFLRMVDGAVDFFEQEEKENNEREQGKQGNPEDRPN